MPKISFDAYERKINGFCKWLRGKKAEEDLTNKALGAALGVTNSAVSYKLRGKSIITYKDLLVFFKEVKASDEEILRFMKME